MGRSSCRPPHRAHFGVAPRLLRIAPESILVAVADESDVDAVLDPFEDELR